MNKENKQDIVAVQSIFDYILQNNGGIDRYNNSRYRGEDEFTIPDGRIAQLRVEGKTPDLEKEYLKYFTMSLQRANDEVFRNRLTTIKITEEDVDSESLNQIFNIIDLYIRNGLDNGFSYEDGKLSGQGNTRTQTSGTFKGMPTSVKSYMLSSGIRDYLIAVSQRIADEVLIENIPTLAQCIIDPCLQLIDSIKQDKLIINSEGQTTSVDAELINLGNNKTDKTTTAALDSRVVAVETKTQNITATNTETIINLANRVFKGTGIAVLNEQTQWIQKEHLDISNQSLSEAIEQLAIELARISEQLNSAFNFIATPEQDTNVSGGNGTWPDPIANPNANTKIVLASVDSDQNDLIENGSILLPAYPDGTKLISTDTIEKPIDNNIMFVRTWNEATNSWVSTELPVNDNGFTIQSIWKYVDNPLQAFENKQKEIREIALASYKKQDRIKFIPTQKKYEKLLKIKLKRKEDIRIFATTKEDYIDAFQQRNSEVFLKAGVVNKISIIARETGGGSTIYTNVSTTKFSLIEGQATRPSGFGYLNNDTNIPGANGKEVINNINLMIRSPSAGIVQIWTTPTPSDPNGTLVWQYNNLFTQTDKVLRMGGKKIEQLAPPTAGTDAATKDYSDAKLLKTETVGNSQHTISRDGDSTDQRVKNTTTNDETFFSQSFSGFSLDKRIGNGNVLPYEASNDNNITTKKYVDDEIRQNESISGVVDMNDWEPIIGLENINFNYSYSSITVLTNFLQNLPNKNLNVVNDFLITISTAESNKLNSVFLRYIKTGPQNYILAGEGIANSFYEGLYFNLRVTMDIGLQFLTVDNNKIAFSALLETVITETINSTPRTFFVVDTTSGTTTLNYKFWKLKNSLKEKGK